MVRFVSKSKLYDTLRRMCLTGSGLAYEFRHSKATIARDSLFTLIKLTQSQEHALEITTDHSVSDVAMSSRFTKESINRYQTLNVFIGLEADYHGRWNEIRAFFSNDAAEPSWLYLWGRFQA